MYRPKPSEEIKAEAGLIATVLRYSSLAMNEYNRRKRPRPDEMYAHHSFNTIPSHRLIDMGGDGARDNPLVDAPSRRFGLPENALDKWSATCYDVVTFLAGMPDSIYDEENKEK